MTFNLGRALQIGLGVLWIIGVILFQYHQGDARAPGPIALWGFGLLAFLVVAATAAQMLVARREASDPLERPESLEVFQFQVISNRANRQLKAEFPNDCDGSVWFMSEDDTKVHEIVIALIGELAGKLPQAFPGDPAGAWMLSDEERTRMQRMRKIVQIQAAAAPEIVTPDVLIIFDARERVDAVLGQAQGWKAIP